MINNWLTFFMKHVIHAWLIQDVSTGRVKEYFFVSVLIANIAHGWTIYVYACVCVCVCIMYACVCVGVCVCVCMCLCLFLLLQTHLTYICSSNMLPKGRWRIKTHVHVPTHNHKWTNTHTHMQAHTPAHKNPHTPTHTHTCATVKCPRVEAKQGEKEPSENKQKD